MSEQSRHNLIWIDLEMTGLDPDRERIIEIATIVTDPKLNILAEGPALTIHQSDTLLDAMDDWNQEHHGQSGLIDRVKTSNLKESDAERETLSFLEHWVKPGTSPACGNSVHQDRRFLRRYMPELANYFHYRNLDVSTLKILAQLWAPDLVKALDKESQHLALQDIRDSIEELRYYRKHFIRDIE